MVPECCSGSAVYPIRGTLSSILSHKICLLPTSTLKCVCQSPCPLLPQQTMCLEPCIESWPIWTWPSSRPPHSPTRRLTSRWGGETMQSDQLAHLTPHLCDLPTLPLLSATCPPYPHYRLDSLPMLWTPNPHLICSAPLPPPLSLLPPSTPCTDAQVLDVPPRQDGGLP